MNSISVNSSQPLHRHRLWCTANLVGSRLFEWTETAACVEVGETVSMLSLWQGNGSEVQRSLDDAVACERLYTFVVYTREPY